MAGTKSKVLIIGATGYIGTPLTKASVKLGHPTFILVRPTTSTDAAKSKLLKSFEESGVTVLKGDLNDHESLVSALRQVDVVVSTVGGNSVLDQTKILDAAKEAGTIKRFFPSEFGNEIDRLEIDFEIQEIVFGVKRKVRREIEKSGIPYTFVAAGSFAGYFVRTLCQENVTTPPRDRVIIWGEGNARAILNDEDDIATFTMKTIDDPRSENKIFNIRPKENILSQNELLALWENKIGKTLEKTVVPKEEVAKLIQESPFPANIAHSIRYSIFVKGDQTSFELGPNDVEATELYPDVKYTTTSEYLDRYV